MDKQNPLGQETNYVFDYDPSVLFSIARKEARAALPNPHDEFFGVDSWTAYELSWLNSKGMPQVAIAEIEFSAEAPNLVESKSLKLYLNSFNQSQMTSQEALIETMQKDLALASGKPVKVVLYDVDAYPVAANKHYQCIDNLDVSCTQYDIDAALLKLDGEQGQQAFCSHIFRSLCPVTGQPDWASVYIDMDGACLQPESLLQYLVSFRQHQGFHEQCVEFIYQHLQAVCQPKRLTVAARFMRRGGLDINPIRSSSQNYSMPQRQARQ